MTCVRPRVYAILSTLLCFLLAAFAPACAQKSELWEKFAKEPHIGTVEQAIVGVEVVNTAPDGTKQVRRGNGFVLRCDGFVLIPTGLMAQKEQGEESKQSIAIILHPGTEQEQRVFARTRPFIFKPSLGYTVVKLREVHVPALRTLLLDTLKPGTEMEVVFLPFDAASGRFGTVQKRKVRVGDPLPKEKANGVRGAMELLDLQEGLPPGAIYLGPDGMAVGIAPGVEGGAKERFVSLELLYQTTNCVTPVATSEADFAKRMKAVQSQEELFGNAPEQTPQEGENAEKTDKASGIKALGDMVRVPGGPVQLTSDMLERQRDMDRVPMACVAPFWIDKYEVTNAQYLNFWNSLTEKQRSDSLTRERMYPLSWNDQGAPFDGAVADLPVIGVRTEGARAYAKWAGKRLPTPYEWMLAAFGPGGGNTLPEWTQRYIQDRQKIWAGVRKAHLEYLQESPPLQPAFKGEIPLEIVYVAGMPTTRTAPHENPLAWHKLPWFLWLPPYERVAEWSKTVTLAAAKGINEAWQRPLQVITPGERTYDVSPYGAHDMALNAIELVCPVPEATEKRLEASPYMQLAWTATDRRGPMLSRLAASDFVVQFEGVMNDAGWGEFPLLSRRLRSATDNISRLTDFVPPGYSDLVTASSGLFEVAALVRPLTHGIVRMFDGPTASIGTIGMSADGSPSMPAIFSDGLTQMTIRQAAAFPFWNRMPNFFLREMGREFALDPNNGAQARAAVLSNSRTIPTDTTLLPGGFRCAR